MGSRRIITSSQQIITVSLKQSQIQYSPPSLDTNRGPQLLLALRAPDTLNQPLIICRKFIHLIA